MKIEIIPCLEDNYAYLVEAGEALAVVDPSEAAPVMKALAGRKLTHILNTHHHWDHVGGNLELKETFGAPIIGPAKDAARIPGMDVGVDEKSGWQFAGHAVQVLEVPGHTRGAIAFVMDGNVFTGDTLFVIGCGRLFEGDAPTMWASLLKLMMLPDDTKIWCGHEYAKANARFALSLEPSNQALVERARNMGPVSVPSTMGQEKRTNPFLRVAQLRKPLGMDDVDDAVVFAEIRRRKYNF